MIVKSQFIYQGQWLELNKNPLKNIITVDSIEYKADRLSSEGKGNKGGHSFVLKLTPCQDDSGNPVMLAMKISNKLDEYDGEEITQSANNGKFYREIFALSKCKDARAQNIITIFNSGHLEVLKKNKKESYTKVYLPFYTMEYASDDLKTYMENPENEIDEGDRLNLCLSIAEGIQSLHGAGFYHRDIKPDNVLIIDDQWKIGDLGLVANRNEDNDYLYKDDEFIGPKGWLSPEAMNRYLIKSARQHHFDIAIDEKSDIFQLGKLFWYILQGNAPIGCLAREDFALKDDSIYSVIRNMLNHSKKKRMDLCSIIREITRIRDKCER